jgi:hypothetical protein
MYPLHSDNFSTGFPSRFWCSSLLYRPNICEVFRRLCLLLNASNGFVWARNACSSEGIFDQNCFELSFRASSAFKIFEAGLRSLELFLSGQQCLQDIRGRSSVPRIVSFGPAAPSRYSRQVFGPSNYFFWASSAFKIFKAGLRSLELSFRVRSAFELFEAGLRSLELSFSAQQCLQSVRA